MRDMSYILMHTTPHSVYAADGSGFAAMALPLISAARAKVQLAPLSRAMDMFAWCTDRNGSGPRALVTSIEQLDPKPDALPADTFVFVGQRGETHPTPSTHWQAAAGWKADDSRPLVLVSFHTSPVLDQRSRVERTLQALADRAPYRVLATTSTVDMGGIAIPSNDVAVPFVPHQHVLSQVAAVVSHGGHGTILAALQYGVPLLLLPSPVGDQPPLSQRVGGAGRRAAAGRRDGYGG